jgi:hypothetical protein
MKFLIESILFFRAPRNWRPVSSLLVFLFFSNTFCFISVSSLAADKTYLSPKNFLKTVFKGDLPKPDVLWLDTQLRSVLKKITGNRYPGVRIRFWKKSNRTAWILEEIGKYEPITVGVVINNRKLELLKVLIYRESHGWEVRHPFFTNQFIGLGLTSQFGLSSSIDGISGATLSVNALKSIAAVALFLHDRALEVE